jgi:multiple sugar transport system substrate-binding protein
MKIQTMSYVLTLSLFTGVLAGCSSGQPQADKGKAAPAAPSATAPATTPADGGSKPQEVVTINVWGAIPEESGPAKVVENWSKANPNIKVNYKRFVNDEAGNTKLETALLANGEVDVFLSYRSDKVMKRIESGMAEPLDAYIKKDNFNIEENFGKQSIVKLKNETFYITAMDMG